MSSVLNKSRLQLIEEIEKLQEQVRDLEQKEIERIKMENALAESAGMFKDLTEKSMSGVYLIQDGIFKYVNPTLAEIFGYNVEEIIEKLGPKDLTYAEDWPVVRENIRKRISGEITSTKYVFRGKKKDNSKIHVEVFGSRTKFNEKPAVIGTLLDISERRKIELELRESELKHRNLFENSPVSLWEEDYTMLKSYIDEILNTGIDDLNKYLDDNPAVLQKCSRLVKIINVNQQALKLHRAKSKEELLGNLEKIFTKNSYFAFKEAIMALAEGKDKVVTEGEVKTLDGNTRYVLIEVHFGNYISNGDTSNFGLVAINDITERKNATDEIKQNRDLLLKAQQVSRMGFLHWDLKTNKVELSDEAKVIFGINSAEKWDTPELIASVVHTDDRQFVRENLEAASKSEKNYDIDHRIVQPDGSIIWIHAQGELFRDNEGNPDILLGTAVDITERKKAEDSLRKSKIRYHQLFEDSPVALWEEDFSGVISYFKELKDSGVSDFRKYFDENNNEVRLCAEKVKVKDVNKAALILHQSISKDQLLGNLAKSLNEKSLEVFKEELIGLAEGKTRFESEVEMIAGHSDYRNIYLRLYVGQTGEGQSNYSQTLIVINDITEQKKAENALKESEIIYRSLVENAVESISITDEEGKLIEWNKALETLSGIPSADAIGKYIWDMLMEINLPELKTKVAGENIKSGIVEFLKTGKAPYAGKLLEVPYIKPDGSLLYIELRITAVKTDKGFILVGTSTDITERKIAENALKESEEKFRNLAENSPNMIFINQKGKIVYANKGCEEFMGYTRDEFYSLDFDFGKLIEPEYLEPLMANFKSHMEGQEVPPIEYTLRTKSGQRIESIINTKLITYGGTAAILGIVTDITERKIAEEAIIESEKLLKEYQRVSQLGSYVLDVTNGVWTSSNILDEIFGIDENYNKTVEGWSRIIHPEDQNSMIEYFTNKVLGEHQSFNREYRIIKLNSSEERWVHGLGELEFDTEGNPVKMIGTIQDITERKQAEERIAHFGRIFEGSLNEIYLFEADTLRFTQVNNAAQNNLGYTIEELQKLTPLDLKPEFTHNSFAKLIIPLRNGEKEKIVFETVHKRKDHSLYDVEVHLQLLKYEQKVLFAAIILDITERKQAEKSLRESEEKLKAIFDSAADGITETDLGGKIVKVNKAILRIYGSESEEDFIGKSALEFFAPFEKIRVLKAYRKTYYESIAEDSEFEALKIDGTQFPVQITSSVLRDVDGNQIGFVGVIKDITERKKAEEALQKSEESLKLAQDIGKVGSWDWDIVNDKLTWSDQAFLQLGLKPKALIPTRKIFDSFVHPDDRDKVTSAIEQTFKQNSPYSIDLRMIKPDGTEWIMHTQGKAIRDSKGNPIRFVGVQQDITERIKAEEEIRKLSHSVEQSPAIVIITDTSGAIEYVNPKFEKVTGYTSKEAIGKNPSILKSGETTPEEYEVLWKTIKAGGEWRGEFHNKKKSGELYWESASITALKDSSGQITHLVAVKEDITERKKAEEALQESQAKWRSITENSPDQIMMLDKNANILFINRTVSNLTREEVIGKPVYNFIPSVFHRRARECFENVLQSGKPGSYETEESTKDGETQYFSISVGPVYREGKIAGLVSSSTGITRQKRIEEKLKESYVRLQSLAGRLQMIREEERASVAREIHDDLGQSLTALKMDIFWMKNNPAKNEKAKENKFNMMLDLVNSTIQTVKRISTQLRPGILDDLGLVSAIEWQADEFQNRFKVKCNFAVNNKDSVVSDEVSIAVFRIFQETMTNVARHSGATAVDINLNFQDDGFLVMEISDNGVGIDEEQVRSPQSFGLFGMRERINILKGEMEIIGEHGKGTKVRVSIPVSKEEMGNK